MEEARQIYISRPKRWLISLVSLGLVFVLSKGFLAGQIRLKADGYLNNAMYKDAARQYKKSLFLDTYSDHSHNWLGFTYEAMGEKDKAMEVYRKAVFSDPTNRTAVMNMGRIFAKEKDYERAAYFFEKATTIVPKDRYDTEEYAQSLIWLATCQKKLGKTGEAINTYKKILVFDPGNKLAKERLKEFPGAEK